MSIRVDRLSDEIRDIIASCFQGGVLSDPRLTDVTITSVVLSADLQIAKVYYRVYNDDNISSAKEGLVHASGFLRKKLSCLDLRRLPELKFFYDDGLEKKVQIEKILEQIKSE